MYKIIDTNVLLEYPDIILKEDNIFIPTVVFQELESIKTSDTKSEETKYKARIAVHTLKDNPDKYNVYCVNNYIDKQIESTYGVPVTHDNEIIMCCKLMSDESILITNDLCMTLIAKNIFHVNTIEYQSKSDVYKGYVEVSMNDEKLAYFYEHLNENQFDCLINEYLIIKDENENIIDKYKWSGSEYKRVVTRGVDSEKLGKCKPLDAYQECAFDSIKDNDITCLFGRAGAGKTTIPLAYLMYQMEKQKISKVYFVYHFETLKNSRQLGYVKGSIIEKELGTSSIGNILATKFGDVTEVERMIEDNKIEIMPTANIRGVEFNENTAVMVTEGQDIDTYTMKTIIQRMKTGSKLIVEGDILEQSDINRFSGMNRMIEVFKGSKSFGVVKLKNNYRSESSELADKM